MNVAILVSLQTEGQFLYIKVTPWSKEYSEIKLDFDHKQLRTFLPFLAWPTDKIFIEQMLFWERNVDRWNQTAIFNRGQENHVSPKLFLTGGHLQL